MSAYSCWPDAGSEPGVAWTQLAALAAHKQFDFTVLTRVKNVAPTCNALDALGLRNVSVVGVDLPRWARFWKRGDLAMHVYYSIWQILAYFKALKLHGLQRFDVAHHLSFMTIRTNMVPFLRVFSIVGPVGGAQVAPRGFGSVVRHPFKEALRTLVIKLMRISPWWRAWVRKTDVLLLANRDNLWVVPEAMRSRCIVRQIGWDSNTAQIPPVTAMESGQNLQIFWGGRLIGWKGLEILLRALPKLAATGQDFHLHVTGKGTDRDYLHSVVVEAGIEDQVTFHGFLPFDRVQALQASADIFAFTSLHETTGTALMEAMALGKALIVVDHAGPGEIANSDCAMMIPVDRGVANTVDECARALIFLAQHRSARIRLGQAAMSRLNTTFGWDAYIAFIVGLYEKGAEHSNARGTAAAEPQ